MSRPVGATRHALTLEDFRAAIDKAPELRYMDAAWPVYETYELKRGEGGTYFCATAFPGMDSPNGTEDRVYEANVDHGIEKEEQSPGGLLGYFSPRNPDFAKKDANEELRNFLVGMLHKTDRAVGDKEERALQEWLSKDYEGLDETRKAHMRDSVYEALDYIDTTAAWWLSDVSRDAVRAFREGGQEHLFGSLRERLKGIDNTRVERLLEAMRADLDRGMDITEALQRLVSVNENGVATPGPEAEKVLSDVKQDAFRATGSKLDEDIRRLRAGSRKLYPLSLPGLFLEFAELAGAEITEDVVKDWVHRYGVLGLGMEYLSGNWHPAHRGTPRESVAAFAREAKEARWTRELYEATLYLDSADDELVKRGIREARRLFGWPEHRETSAQECKEKALDAIELQVRDRLGNHCATRFRRAGNGLADFLEYRTLLGALYLQFAWVLRERANVRRCKWCGERIGLEPGTREQKGEAGNKVRKPHKNTEFCSRQCRYDYNNERKRKKRKEANLGLSVEPGNC